jgi:hypothetical protein
VVIVPIAMKEKNEESPFISQKTMVENSSVERKGYESKTLYTEVGHVFPNPNSSGEIKLLVNVRDEKVGYVKEDGGNSCSFGSCPKPTSSSDRYFVKLTLFNKEGREVASAKMPAAIGEISQYELNLNNKEQCPEGFGEIANGHYVLRTEIVVQQDLNKVDEYGERTPFTKEFVTNEINPETIDLKNKTSNTIRDRTYGEEEGEKAHFQNVVIVK